MGFGGVGGLGGLPQSQSLRSPKNMPEYPSLTGFTYKGQSLYLCPLELPVGPPGTSPFITVSQWDRVIEKIGTSPLNPWCPFPFISSQPPIAIVLPLRNCSSISYVPHLLHSPLPLLSTAQAR